MAVSCPKELAVEGKSINVQMRQRRKVIKIIACVKL